MRISGREPSTVPGQVGAKLTGRDPKTQPQVAERLNPIVHWVHGISLGAVRGLLGLAGLSFLPATGVFFLVVWGGDVLLYRVLTTWLPVFVGWQVMRWMTQNNRI